MVLVKDIPTLVEKCCVRCQGKIQIRRQDTRTMKRPLCRTSDAAHKVEKTHLEENIAKMKTTKTYQDHQVISRWAKVPTCPFSLACSCRSRRSAIRDPYVRDTHDIPWLDFSFWCLSISFQEATQNKCFQIEFVQGQNVFFVSLISASQRFFARFAACLALRPRVPSHTFSRREGSAGTREGRLEDVDIAQTWGARSLGGKNHLILTGRVILSHAQMCMKCWFSTLCTSASLGFCTWKSETTFRAAWECQELVSGFIRHHAQPFPCNLATFWWKWGVSECILWFIASPDLVPGFSEIDAIDAGFSWQD